MQTPKSPLTTSGKGTAIEGIIRDGSRLREGHDIVEVMSPNNRKKCSISIRPPPSNKKRSIQIAPPCPALPPPLKVSDEMSQGTRFEGRELGDILESDPGAILTSSLIRFLFHIKRERMLLLCVSAMAAPFFSTPFQPYVYQSPQDAMIPFQILGGEAQVVQNVFAGSMCFMSGSTEMENVFLPENEVGMWHWVFGKSITSVVFRNPGPSDGFVGIAAPSLARILPIDLAMFGGEILCQPDAFLCSVSDVKVSNAVDHRARNVVAGAEGFLRQKLSGQGLAFILAGGSVVQKNLEVGEVLAVDVSCIVALTSTVNVQIKYNGPMRKAMFGGDNLVTAVLTGPGIVFIQSLPFHRLSQRIARAVTSPNMRENPKFFLQIAIFFFLAYVVIVSSLILTDV
ncbi:hypothetical protein TIFTF001_003120 [Ficus carica]|uniref:Altered inheritance of mitochondria protein 24, mitochondrial n=1 Tax=Ficus carica TaxID=3494 RepID=A0AA88CVA7_FICCA|nr:hypothetical protein TIFTF001_003120 [Ficus carica]